MTEENLFTTALALVVGLMGLICIIVSFVSANIVSRYRPRYLLSAQLVISGFPLPLPFKVFDYSLSEEGSDLLTWVIDRPLVDTITSGACIMVGSLTAWLVLRKRVHRNDPKVFE